MNGVSLQAEISTIPADIAAMDVDQLRAAWAECEIRIASDVIRMGAIARRMRDLGEEPPVGTSDWFGYLLRVGWGQVKAEIVARFIHNPNVLRRAASLPIPDQEALVRGERVDLVVRGDGNTFTTRKVDPAKLMPSQVNQVFDVGRMRDESEQIQLLEAEPVSSNADDEMVRLVLKVRTDLMKLLTKTARASGRKPESLAVRFIMEGLGE